MAGSSPTKTPREKGFPAKRNDGYQSINANGSLSRYFLLLFHLRYSVAFGGPLRYLDRLQPLALLIMRLALGAVMVAHGYQNVFRHMKDHVHLVANLGIPAWLGYVSSFVEFIGGLLILTGFLTRPAAFAVCIDLIVALWKVHWHNGLMGSPDRPGAELPLALAALAFALIFFGGGPISMDHVLGSGGGGSSRR